MISKKSSSYQKDKHGKGQNLWIALGAMLTVFGMMGCVTRIDTGSIDSDGNTIVNSTIIGIPIEKYKADLEEKEKEIRALYADKKISEKEKHDLQVALAEVERRLADTEASYKAYIKDLEERVARLDQLKGQIPDALIAQAQAALSQGDTTQAEQLFAQVEENADPHIAAAAEVAYQRGKLAEDAIHYREAYRQYERAARFVLDNSTYLNQAGVLARKLGDYEKAIDYFEQALASDLKTFDVSYPKVKVAAVRNNLGSAWYDKGDYDKAIVYYEQALASDLETFGEGHPRVATERSNLGVVWDAKGDYDKAIGYYEQALASDLKTFGADHPSVATERNNLGGAWQAKGDYDKAIGYYEQALTSDLKTLGADHPNVAIDRNNLGEVLQAKGDYDKAIGYFEQAYQILRDKLGDNHPNTKVVKSNLESAKKAAH